MNPRLGIRRKLDYLIDKFFFSITFLAAVLVPLLLIGILLVFIKEASLAIQTFGFFSFILSPEWDPVFEKFGGAVPLTGTILVASIAVTVGVPIALGIAIFVSEVCPNFLKQPIRLAVDLLAAIPSIVYGLWGLFTLAPIHAKYIEPFLQKVFTPIPLVGKLFEGTLLGIDLFTAGIILSIMIIPFTASIAIEAFSLVPRVLKESAYGMGATKWEVIKDVMIPYCRIAIFGGMGLSLGRALGETMAVAFVLGNINRFPESLFSPTTTVTVKLANEFTEADKDIHLSALFYLALLLYVMSLFIIGLSKYLILRVTQK
ncbi:MAG: phosphate ABC transporter permease subunit PstC [Thermodesulfobacteriaceae bacterium]|jgi:phosphate transport system permease protein